MFKRYPVLKSFCLSILMLASSLYRSTLYAQAPMPPAQQGPDISHLLERMPTNEEDLAKWQQEVDAEINKYVSTLPPEQQQQFYKDVDELTNVMSNMSDEELNGFLSTVMTPEQQQPPTPNAQPMPTPSQKPMPVVKPQEDTKHVVIPAKHSVEQIRKILLSIADHCESFLLKIKTMALPGERVMKNWLALNVKSKTSWDIMRADLETLSQRLHTIAQERIPGTQKYRYLPLVVEQESLCNNLERMNEILKKSEPAIEPPAFGLGDLERSSQDAIEKTARILTEALYMMNITASLEAIIKQFDPEAKKLREAEEATKKQAGEAAKRKPKATPLIQTPASEPMYAGGGSGPLYPGYQAYQPAPYTPPTQRAKEEEEKAKKELDAKKTGTDKKEAPKKDDGSTTVKSVEDKKGDEIAESLHEALEEFKEIMDEYPLLKNIQQHAAEPGNADPMLVNQAFSRAKSNLERINEKLRALRAHITRMKKAKRGNVEAFTKEINTFNNDYGTDLNNLNAQIEAVIQNPPKSAEKRKKYLGMKEEQPEPTKKPATADDTKPQEKKVVTKEEVEEQSGELHKMHQNLKKIIDYLKKPIA